MTDMDLQAKLDAMYNAIGVVPYTTESLGELLEACRAVSLDARVRSGGSVYMIRKDQFLRFRSAIANLEATTTA